jgi:hypothetical protein
MLPLLKRPSAWVPIALSLAMLVLIVTLLSIYGIPTPYPTKDEGAGAHLFQLWLVVEVLIVVLFVAKWLPQAPKQALLILALQIIAVVATCAPVFFLRL